MTGSNAEHRLELVAFEIQFASAILAWAQHADDALAWANLAEPPRDPSIFSTWHQQPGVRPYVLLDGGAAVAYGEIWQEPGGDEIELARIIVAPARRGRGIGRLLVEHLLAQSEGSKSAAFVRVRPGNLAALACYRRAGFAPVSSAAASLYNVGQPVEYVWLSHQLSPT
ncbi:MAG TPA: GNAT family N-acetyltransferase [Pirellulales bacterium]|jgi:ribosomal protein S18 acetylase RimI-like enzyme|nr:GNAT family N-acetyltransferase [Pirellulales bacterium]